MNLSNYKNQKIHFLNFIDIILKYFPFILIIILCFSYLFINKNFTAFEHNTLSFNAGLEFYDNREEIDYITSSILESPKIIIIRFVNFFQILQECFNFDQLTCANIKFIVSLKSGCCF